MAQSNGVVMVQDNESIDKNKKYTVWNWRLRKFNYNYHETTQVELLFTLLQVYKVVINVHGRALFIYRRYDEFYSLYEKVSISAIS